ncbi:hypothetical protein, partial [Hydrogenophaga sp. Root209]|uniref:hypothetical protein n=1 Tax=Hydrogenophaga sp. Root209 TaxID=1736490 RepID=UPI001F21D5BB
CGPIDGSGDIGGSLTPQIGDPALHHKDQLVCGGCLMVPWFSPLLVRHAKRLNLMHSYQCSGRAAGFDRIV